MPTPHYDQLMSHVRQTAALEQAAGLLGWDQETMMPPEGAAQRAEQAAALTAAIHARRADGRIADWLDALSGVPLEPKAARNVDLVSRAHRKATRVPERLAVEMARTFSQGQHAWAAARRSADVSMFLPILTRIVALKREEAAARSEDGAALYDTLIDDFEPGLTMARLDPIFRDLRTALSDLRARIAGSGRAAPRIRGRFPRAAQLDLSARLAPVFGYSLAGGRIDLAQHPFCSGAGGDVRITTRTDEADPLGCLYSTIHEIGHAIYKQNIPRDEVMDPVGDDHSMGLHESQSRMMENQIARSRPFADFLWPILERSFGDMGLSGPEDLYRAVNRVETGHIRTEADEVHYNLHVILRYRLERDLIEGRLDPADLEEAWNESFEQDFGIPVPDPARGMLQDIHWSQGLFGYFPTYSLGNLYAAELFASMKRDIPGTDALIAEGRLQPLIDWLSRSVHVHGSARDPLQIMETAIGHAPTAGPLVAYLEEKFGALYGV